MPRSFTGTSVNFDLKEALIDALEQATTLEGGTDVLIKWTIEKISGTHGGFAGFHDMSVTIVTET
jgi:hypothetical protein